MRGINCRPWYDPVILLRRLQDKASHFAIQSHLKLEPLRIPRAGLPTPPIMSMDARMPGTLLYLSAVEA